MTNEKKTGLLTLAFDVLEILVTAVLVAAVLYGAGFRHVQVNGGSMQNTLQDGEQLITANWFYQPSRGDIVVINQYDSKKVYQEYELQTATVPLIKRVIGVAGDTVRITAEAVYVNGEKLDEPYVFGSNQPNAVYTGTGVTDEVVVPEGHFFVMGDHRDASADSRFAEIGFISEEDIMGKAVWRLSPFGALD